MRYPIIIHPNDKLRKPSKRVTEITDELLALLDDLHETMIAHYRYSAALTNAPAYHRARHRHPTNAAHSYYCYQYRLLSYW